MKWIKKEKIFEHTVANDWWESHTMAPSAIYWKDKIRVFIGAWDKKGISRITYIDLNPLDPSNIIKVQDQFPILDIGEDGMFDENGVFPGHACVLDNKIHLYYTGFQSGVKIPHYNFGGLAISEDGEYFNRVKKSPILDRQNEGLFVRAGQSVLKDEQLFRTVYSIGSSFMTVGGKLRPTYDICYQESSNEKDFKDKGVKIITRNPSLEHGLGRPQIIKIRKKYFIFYTRRMINMRYYIGCSESEDGKNWKKNEEIFSELFHSKNGFDSSMIYFPSVVYVPLSDKYYLIYCGNEFGKTGIGFAELKE